jgi:hypothetical protein
MRLSAAMFNGGSLQGTGMKLKLVVATLSFALISSQANALLVSAPPKAQHTPAAIWAVFGCTGSVVVAALTANYWQHRQLTPYEAATCGIAFWLTPPRTR